jgi:hypothetical protein
MILAHSRNTINPLLFPQGAQALRLWDGGTRMGLLNPAKGQFVWDRLDAHLAASEAAGLKSIYTFGSTPAWAAIPTSGQAGIIDPTSNRPMDPQALSDFVDALMAHCGSRLWAIETWNEWNTPAFWVGSVAQLAVQQYIIYTRAKRANPNIIVTTPTPCYPGSGLYPNVALAMAAFLPTQMPWDVMTFHGYTAPGSPASSVLPFIQALKVMAAGKPLWDTEFGPIPGDAALATPDAQRLWALNAWIVREEAGLDLACWYQWDNQTHGTCTDLAGNLSPFGVACTDFAATVSK